MPCYDPLDSYSYVLSNEIEPLQDKLNRTEAYLCGVLTALHKSGHLGRVLLNVDYDEGGFKIEDIQRWWHLHQQEDQRRKSAERQKRIKERARKRRELERLAQELGVKLPETKK